MIKLGEVCPISLDFQVLLPRIDWDMEHKISTPTLGALKETTEIKFSMMIKEEEPMLITITEMKASQFTDKLDRMTFSL